MEQEKKFKSISIIVAVVLVGASFFAGIFYGEHHRPAVEKVTNVFHKETPPELKDVDFNLFWDVWNRVQEKYVDRSSIDRQKLVYGAISGLVASLDDPYSQFFPPEEAKQFKEDISGSFGGIGAEIGIRRGILTIVAPLKKSPAEKAGIKAGDKVLKIDSTIAADLDLQKAVSLIRGKIGTTVKLTILRDSADSTKEISIVRDNIVIPVLDTEKRANGIFIIKLYHFTENAGTEFRKAVQEFQSSGSTKLILDLRNNPGGFLEVAVDIGSWFIPAGEAVAREQLYDGTEHIYRSRGYGVFENVPTVLLVNEGSASASEIVAGALRDSRGITLVGKKTFGKGVVQEVQDLSSNSSLKITIAKWLTPKGLEINKKGLDPDLDVELPKDDTATSTEKDLILEKGIEVLEGKVQANKK